MLFIEFYVTDFTYSFIPQLLNYNQLNFRKIGWKLGRPGVLHLALYTIYYNLKLDLTMMNNNFNRETFLSESQFTIIFINSRYNFLNLKCPSNKVWLYQIYFNNI